jgi:hypothetical protein
MNPPAGKMAGFWGDLDLAKRGYIRSLEQLKKDMLELL